jgi:hypothetical protein
MSPLAVIAAASASGSLVGGTEVRYLFDEVEAAMKWKLLGLAGLVGVVAVGATTVNRHRARSWTDYEPEDLRERLHERLRSSIAGEAGASGSGSEQRNEDTSFR